MKPWQRLERTPVERRRYLSELRSYSELMTFETFKDRYEYLHLKGEVGAATFGFDRYLNQQFYRSSEWKRVRESVIARDNGCDLAIPDREIFSRCVVHHMNPIMVSDLEDFNSDILNPEFLITTTPLTHNAIHYGCNLPFTHLPPDRKPGDTIPWR